MSEDRDGEDDEGQEVGDRHAQKSSGRSSAHEQVDEHEHGGDAGRASSSAFIGATRSHRTQVAAEDGAAGRRRSAAIWRSVIADSVSSRADAGARSSRPSVSSGERLGQVAGDVVLAQPARADRRGAWRRRPAGRRRPRAPGRAAGPAGVARQVDVEEHEVGSQALPSRHRDRVLGRRRLRRRRSRRRGGGGRASIEGGSSSSTSRIVPVIGPGWAPASTLDLEARRRGRPDGTADGPRRSGRRELASPAEELIAEAEARQGDAREPPGADGSTASPTIRARARWSRRSGAASGRARARSMSPRCARAPRGIGRFEALEALKRALKSVAAGSGARIR